MPGFFSIERDLLEHPLWLDEPFTRGQAWIDLIGLANHKPGWLRIAGERIEIARGESGWSESRLSERWKWSRGKLRRFLSELERDDRIIRNPNIRTTVITICNYDSYQSHSTTDDTTNGTADKTADGHQAEQQTDTRRYTNNNVKKKKNVKKKEDAPIDLPVWLPIPEWEAFKEMRISINDPMTLYAERLAVNKLGKFQAAGADIVAILNQSTMNNWKDLYPLKQQGELYGNSTKDDRAKAAILRGLATAQGNAAGPESSGG